MTCVNLKTGEEPIHVGELINNEHLLNYLLPESIFWKERENPFLGVAQARVDELARNEKTFSLASCE